MRLPSRRGWARRLTDIPGACRRLKLPTEGKALPEPRWLTPIFLYHRARRHKCFRARIFSIRRCRRIEPAGSSSIPCTPCTGKSPAIHAAPRWCSCMADRAAAARRIIGYDQRGAGQSTPLGALTDNTTPHLVADLERLRAHLGVQRWLVFGGSWGSTLALAYAEAHPDRVRGLVLRGIFLCRPLEIRWFLYEMRFIFPEAWRAFAGFLPEAERGDLLAGYYRRLID